MTAHADETPVLRVSDVTLDFRVTGRWLRVLHGVHLAVRAGEKVALVGESGSGKSVTARLVLGLLQRQPGTRVGGRIDFSGYDITHLSDRAFRHLRGKEISMIFQDPTSALNPVFPIGRQFREVLDRRQPGIGAAEATARAAAMLEEVLIDQPDRVLASYPFQLSGGMNQRVLIAMALANTPSLLLADEPGTALDVTVQAQTLKLMHDLTERHGTAVLFISHNLGVVREFAQRAYVIYRGRIVEEGTVERLFHDPRHPYTQALMSAVPKIDGSGLPALPPDEAAFAAPPVVHDGDGTAGRGLR